MEYKNQHTLKANAPLNKNGLLDQGTRRLASNETRFGPAPTRASGGLPVSSIG